MGSSESHSVFYWIKLFVQLFQIIHTTMARVHLLYTNTLNMGLRAVTKNKLLFVIVLCFLCVFIVREKLFVGRIKKLLEEAAQGSVKNESGKTTTTTKMPQLRTY